MDAYASTARMIGLFLLIILGLLVVILIGMAPGHVARRRGHPSAEAVSLCGWIGLLIWPCWIVAIIWAHTGPDRSKRVSRPSPLPALPANDGGAKEVVKHEPGFIMPGLSRQERRGAVRSPPPLSR